MHIHIIGISLSMYVVLMLYVSTINTYMYRERCIDMDVYVYNTHICVYICIYSNEYNMHIYICIYIYVCMDIYIYRERVT